ncbi:methylmalonyl Co-A mutase-associated GTPase MeaB [Pseudothermotoga thermarum]|uniref:LAO/AO transport system ATPase n=1 Tax=Pseudothermotoga thermarum DSM 5069 TaxID=688269 RepID=F7YYH0_9THEM|nr:methylmalonyl Co-A mutase-associated GTPase MeaB [Pseudothermotoga thermarum]AEH50994.1 LAO/AO transport system ATPase [Pseudothermotoga thermarum DSM 5069]
MDHKQIAKLITTIENNPDKARQIVEQFPERIGRVVGFTGSPGVGKSTLVDQVVSVLRKRGKTVAVVAVDPSSPFTKGAFLGDRIRMKRHFVDDGVFIRSMASRGALGGLCDAIFDVVTLLERVGFDYVLVETVGVGQSEVEVRYVADVVVLVLSPGFGDDIQVLKSGVMEIADLYVLNKADMPESERLYDQLTAFLSISAKNIPIVKTIATTGNGVEDLVSKVETILENLQSSGELIQRRRRRTKHHAEHMLRRILQKSLEEVEEDDAHIYVEKVLKKLCQGT